MPLLENMNREYQKSPIHTYVLRRENRCHECPFYEIILKIPGSSGKCNKYDEQGIKQWVKAIEKCKTEKAVFPAVYQQLTL
jgi:translation elongation factor EF-1alpha